MPGKVTPSEDLVFPPGPSSTSDFDVKVIHKHLLDHSRKFGKFSYFQLGGKHIVSMNTVGAIRDVLNSPEIMGRPDSFSQKYILKEDIAVQSYSDDWNTLRVAMVKGIGNMTQMNEEMLAAQKSELSFLVKRLKDRGDTAFDPRDAITSSIINGMLIGLIGCRFDYDHDIFACFRQFDCNGLTLYGDPKANYILSRLPWLRCCCCGYGRQYHKTVEAKDKIAGYILGDHKKEGHTHKQGLVYEMLRQQKGDPCITNQKIVSVIMDMHIGGILTTSSAMFSVVYQLLCHPDVQTRLHEEIDAVLGKETVTFEALDKMPYAQAVTLELFRQCPVLPTAVPRTCLADVTVGQYRLPKDTIFMPNLFGMNHDRDVWDDPWRFDPARFLDESGQLLQADHPTRRKLVTFGDGKRKCPGEFFARSRFLLHLVNMYQHFEVYNDDPKTFTMAKGDPMEYSRLVILYAPVYRIKLKERT